MIFYKYCGSLKIHQIRRIWVKKNVFPPYVPQVASSSATTQLISSASPKIYNGLGVGELHGSVPVIYEDTTTSTLTLLSKIVRPQLQPEGSIKPEL